jgi:4-hydroxythreonine-4-phosphate dehydrogenase
MLRKLLRVRQVEMMMVHRRFRVVPLTRHVPLRRVPRMVTADRIVEAARLVARELRVRFGIDEPRLALVALNPHAGEGGVIGREEEEVFRPALRRLRGISVEGPFAADGFFRQWRRLGFDAVLTPTHDQGLVPFKMVSQWRGVNVTLGLPVPRTSPDHGTAFDIAGRGVADPAGMIAAYRLAERLAHTDRRRREA